MSSNLGDQTASIHTANPCAIPKNSQKTLLFRWRTPILVLQEELYYASNASRRIRSTFHDEGELITSLHFPHGLRRASEVSQLTALGRVIVVKVTPPVCQTVLFRFIDCTASRQVQRIRRLSLRADYERPYQIHWCCTKYLHGIKLPAETGDSARTASTSSVCTD